MLKAAANIAPRGVYVCGNTSTTSGLTVTLAKDGAAGDYALEAGALVLGDQGERTCQVLYNTLAPPTVHTHRLLLYR